MTPEKWEASEVSPVIASSWSHGRVSMWGKQTRNLAESATWKSSQEARCIQWLELSKQSMRKKQDMWRSILDIRSGLLESSEAYYQRMPMKKLPEQGKELSTISSLFLGSPRAYTVMALLPMDQNGRKKWKSMEHHSEYIKGSSVMENN